MKRTITVTLLLLFLFGTVMAESQTPSKTEEPSVPEIETLTRENNDDVEILFTVPDNFDFYEEFVTKYKGQIIEFDGHIAHMDPHGSYKTRYDFLIFVGDYEEDGPGRGVPMQFRDVNVFDLHLTGDVPAYIGRGDNLHVIAKIEGIINGYLILLKPVSVSIREMLD